MFLLLCFGWREFFSFSVKCFSFVFGLCLLYWKCFFTSVDLLGNDFFAYAWWEVLFSYFPSLGIPFFFFSLSLWFGGCLMGSAFNFCCITGNCFCQSLIAGKCFFPPFCDWGSPFYFVRFLGSSSCLCLVTTIFFQFKLGSAFSFLFVR